MAGPRSDTAPKGDRRVVLGKDGCMWLVDARGNHIKKVKRKTRMIKLKTFDGPNTKITNDESDQTMSTELTHKMSDHSGSLSEPFGADELPEPLPPPSQRASSSGKKTKKQQQQQQQLSKAESFDTVGSSATHNTGGKKKTKHHKTKQPNPTPQERRSSNDPPTSRRSSVPPKTKQQAQPQHPPQERRSSVPKNAIRNIDGQLWRVDMDGTPLNKVKKKVTPKALLMNQATLESMHSSMPTLSHNPYHNASSSERLHQRTLTPKATKKTMVAAASERSTRSTLKPPSLADINLKNPTPLGGSEEEATANAPPTKKKTTHRGNNSQSARMRSQTTNGGPLVAATKGRSRSRSRSRRSLRVPKAPSGRSLSVRSRSRSRTRSNSKPPARTPNSVRGIDPLRHTVHTTSSKKLKPSTSGASHDPPQVITMNTLDATAPPPRVAMTTKESSKKESPFKKDPPLASARRILHRTLSGRSLKKSSHRSPAHDPLRHTVHQTSQSKLDAEDDDEMDAPPSPKRGLDFLMNQKVHEHKRRNPGQPKPTLIKQKSVFGRVFGRKGGKDKHDKHSNNDNSTSKHQHILMNESAYSLNFDAIDDPITPSRSKRKHKMNEKLIKEIDGMLWRVDGETGQPLNQVHSSSHGGKYRMPQYPHDSNIDEPPSDTDHHLGDETTTEHDDGNSFSEWEQMEESFMNDSFSSQPYLSQEFSQEFSVAPAAPAPNKPTSGKLDATVTTSNTDASKQSSGKARADHPFGSPLVGPTSKPPSQQFLQLQLSSSNSHEDEDKEPAAAMNDEKPVPAPAPTPTKASKSSSKPRSASKPRSNKKKKSKHQQQDHLAQAAAEAATNIEEVVRNLQHRLQASEKEIARLVRANETHQSAAGDSRQEAILLRKQLVRATEEKQALALRVGRLEQSLERSRRQSGHTSVELADDIEGSNRSRSPCHDDQSDGERSHHLMQQLAELREEKQALVETMQSQQDNAKQLLELKEEELRFLRDELERMKSQIGEQDLAQNLRRGRSPGKHHAARRGSRGGPRAEPSSVPLVGKLLGQTVESLPESRSAQKQREIIADLRERVQSLTDSNTKLKYDLLKIQEDDDDDLRLAKAAAAMAPSLHRSASLSSASSRVLAQAAAAVVAPKALQRSVSLSSQSSQKIPSQIFQSSLRDRSDASSKVDGSVWWGLGGRDGSGGRAMDDWASPSSNNGLRDRSDGSSKVDGSVWWGGFGGGSNSDKSGRPDHTTTKNRSGEIASSRYQIHC